MQTSVSLAEMEEGKQCTENDKANGEQTVEFNHIRKGFGLNFGHEIEICTSPLDWLTMPGQTTWEIGNTVDRIRPGHRHANPEIPSRRPPVDDFA